MIAVSVPMLVLAAWIVVVALHAAYRVGGTLGHEQGERDGEARVRRILLPFNRLPVP